MIDDLTIRNQKLKKRLKKFQTIRNPPINTDKLFEIKVHGLPPAKKLELEQLLGRFAQDINESASRPSTGFKKPGSPMSSTRFADSGYGSLATTQRVSSSGADNRVSSQPGDNESSSTKAEVSQTRRRNIHSFLHDIPEGLMPKHPRAMTEKAKKKLVVRRLESIFSGRGAVPGVHQQPLQQQEVSQSAALAEKSAIEAEGGRTSDEGVREAHIMHKETEDPMDVTNGQKQSSPRAGRSPQKEGTSSFSSPFPEQRPTRPLDLDPDRAQDPKENIDYIRHLGFELRNSPLPDGHGWIYMNLLVNLAQLHTLNVTADFVKKAVSEYSSSFELAPDGRKIRWKGSAKSASESNTSPANTESSPLSSDDRSSKRPRPAYLEGDEFANASKRQEVPSLPNKTSYIPLFPPKPQDYDSDASMADDSSEVSSPFPEGDTGGSSGTRLSSLSAKRREDGPIIFYNNVKFYTDLSGQKPKLHDILTQLADSPLGDEVVARTSTPRSTIRARDRPLYQTDALSSDAMSVDSLDISSTVSFGVEQPSGRRVTFAQPEKPMDFEASGLGGVIPKDNIAISVTRQTTRAAAKEAHRDIPTWLRDVLPQTSTQPHINEKLLSVQTVELPPSELPDAFMPFDDDDDSSDVDSNSDASARASEEENEDDDDSSSHRPDARMRDATSPESTRPIPPESCASSMLSEDGNSPRVDFLAGARAVDPAAIQAKEREYDAEMADRLAEEIPAGSSAATAGGGGASGFNSPADGLEVERKRRTMSDAGSDEEDEDEDGRSERSISS